VPRPERTGELAGGVLIGLASVQFGIVVILGKLAQRSGISVFAMLGVRFGIAAALLAVLVAALRQSLVAARRERMWLVGLGFLGYAVESSLFFAALRHGEAAAVTLLFFTYPVFVAATSALIGRGLPRPLIAIALACALGCAALVVAFSGRLAIAPAGVLFALGSALSFTVYLLVLDHTVHRTDPLVTSMWVAGTASVALFVYAAASGGSWSTSGGKTWAELAGMGAATAGAFVCLFVGLKRLGPVRTSIVAAAEPLATTILAYVILHERVRWAMGVGGLLILVGAVMATLARGAAPAAEPPVP